jgi:hypothetical protein
MLKVPFHSMPLTVALVDVARAFAEQADRNGVDDVVDLLVVHAQGGVAVGAEVADGLERELPGLRRHQVGIAGVGLAVVEVDGGEEVVEVELADAALQLEVDVELRRRLPGHGQRALRAPKLRVRPPPPLAPVASIRRRR